MPPSLSSVRLPQFQRQSPILNNNLLANAQAPEKRQFEAFEQAKVRAKAFAERKAQENGPSPSTFAVQKPPIVPNRPKTMPIWELARTLREKEENERMKPGAKSTAAVSTLSTITNGPRMMPVWELARILKEKEGKERKESGLPSAIYMQSLKDSVSYTTTRIGDHDQSLQYVNQTANTGARVSVSQEVSSAPAHTSESSQSCRLREQR
ncbi:hypothetical protein DID88_001945 [Monilinia fructigena]|uniref:Uncharacterized protein n=1 Tax=Monilinia fructigena TaxID=38457 RepID=A0A395J1F5_9HELO|nr:hypothetical protein DID88_001945 [Monilinia fructigena]